LDYHDALNTGIIRILQEEPRASTKSIAEALQTSEAKVAARIKALTANKMIQVVLKQSIHASDPTSVTAIIELYVDDPKALPEVEAAVCKFDEVFSAYGTTRRPEIIVNCRARSPRELNDIVMRMAKEIPHLGQMRTLPILDLGRYSTTLGALGMPERKPPVEGDVGEQLIRLLQEDGRQSVSALSRQLGLSVTATRYRMEQLLKRPGVSIGLVCESQAAGFTTWFDVRISVAPAHLEAALDRFSEHDGVRVVAHLAGEENLNLFLVMQTLEEVDDFVRDEIRPLPGLINFSMLRVLRVFKYDYNFDL